MFGKPTTCGIRSSLILTHGPTIGLSEQPWDPLAWLGEQGYNRR